MQLISSSKNPFSSNESSFSWHKNTPDNNTLTDLNSAIHWFFHADLEIINIMTDSNFLLKKHYYIKIL